MEENIKFTEEERNQPYFKGLTPYTIMEMVQLAIPQWDWDKYDKKNITFSVMKREESIYGRGGEYCSVSLPVSNEDYTEYGFSFEIKIWEDGLFCYENGNNCSINYKNPLKIYKILLENFKKDE